MSEIMSSNFCSLERDKKRILKDVSLSKDIKYLSLHKLIQKLLKRYEIAVQFLDM